MTLKKGFKVGAIIGVIIGSVAIGVLKIESLNLDWAAVSNFIISLMTLVILVFTPLIIFSPAFLNTTGKGSLVGFPWGVDAAFVGYEFTINIQDKLNLQ